MHAQLLFLQFGLKAIKTSLGRESAMTPNKLKSRIACPNIDALNNSKVVAFVPELLCHHLDALSNSLGVYALCGDGRVTCWQSKHDDTLAGRGHIGEKTRV